MDEQESVPRKHCHASSCMWVLESLFFSARMSAPHPRGFRSSFSEVTHCLWVTLDYPRRLLSERSPKDNALLPSGSRVEPRCCPRRTAHVTLRSVGCTEKRSLFLLSCGRAGPLLTSPYTRVIHRKRGLTQNSKKQSLFHNFCPSQRHMMWKQISEITDKQAVFFFSTVPFSNAGFRLRLEGNKEKSRSSRILTMHQSSFMNKIWVQQAARKNAFSMEVINM